MCLGTAVLVAELGGVGFPLGPPVIGTYGCCRGGALGKSAHPASHTYTHTTYVVQKKLVESKHMVLTSVAFHGLLSALRPTF